MAPSKYVRPLTVSERAALERARRAATRKCRSLDERRDTGPSPFIPAWAIVAVGTLCIVVLIVIASLISGCVYTSIHVTASVNSDATVAQTAEIVKAAGVIAERQGNSGVYSD